MRGNVIWIWGMSGVGKTTLGFHLAQDLGYLFLDSDVVRNFLGITPDFSRQGRLNYQEALRGHVRELQHRGNNLVVASITPFKIMRDLNRKEIQNYTEVYLTCNFDELLDRDPKGLYKKALLGSITDFTGVSSEFEEPGFPPDIDLDTSGANITDTYFSLYNEILRRIG
jgi:adenylylsulfate kinase-like enzyme